MGEITTYEGKFEAVDTISGACKLALGDDAVPLRCKITDPALAVPENVYTRALHTKAPVVVTAKPVIKDGSINQLYISDARPRRVGLRIQAKR